MNTNKLLVGLMLSCIIILSCGQDLNCFDKELIRVTGSGENRVIPTIAIIYSTLSAEGSTAQEALSQLDGILDQVTSGLEKSGDNLTDIRASAISVYPKYSFINMTNTITGYQVFLSLTVTISGIDSDSKKIARVMDTLGNAGVLTISGITYDTEDPKAGKTVARTNAFDDAKQKATLYAQLGGGKLGKITLIEQTYISYSPYYYNTPSMTSYPTYTTSETSMSSDTGSTTGGTVQIPDIPIGTILVTATVFITWQLK